VMTWAWGAVLIGSLFTIVGFARAGSLLFWKSTALPMPVPAEGEEAPVLPLAARPLEVAPAMAAVLLLGMLALFAGPVATYLEATAGQLYDRDGYVGAVLGTEEEG